jgi:hypothetical protein
LKIQFVSFAIRLEEGIQMFDLVELNKLLQPCNALNQVKISIRNANDEFRGCITTQGSSLLQLNKEMEDVKPLLINLIVNVRILLPLLSIVFPEIEKLAKSFLANCVLLGLCPKAKEKQDSVVKGHVAAFTAKFWPRSSTIDPIVDIAIHRMRFHIN